MQEKIKGIVLNVRKYNDRNNIVTLYTSTRGRLSFISPIGTGRASNARRARLQILSVISTELNFKSTSDLQRLGSITLERVWNDIYFHPVKRAEVIFLSEFLYRLLNAAMPDESLWNYIYDSLILLDGLKKGIEDFHISFLISLLPHMGIQPELSGYGEDKVFDFAAGGFVSSFDARGPVLVGEEAKAVVWVNRINFYNISRIRLTGMERQTILSRLISYYSYHYPGLSSMISPEILHDIFKL